jgi:hypothetical protein
MQKAIFPFILMSPTLTAMLLTNDESSCLHPTLFRDHFSRLSNLPTLYVTNWLRDITASPGA